MASRRRLRPSVLLQVALALIASNRLSAQIERKVLRLADGVYEIQHRDGAEGIASGNTTVIIGDRQVFVVDAGFRPSDAREDIAQIRQWTNNPVVFILNTHFHLDHNLGNRAYMDAFPAVTVIAHVETKKDLELLTPGTLSRTQRVTAAYERLLDTGKNGDGQPLTSTDSAEVKHIVASRTAVENEIKTMTFQYPTLTFDHDFDIDLGNRVVQVKFLGRGNTAGDAVVYLPKERIAVTGDLVVNPFPYAFDGFPSEWIETLRKLSQLDAGTVVPGHGPVMHDMSYVLLVRDLLSSAVAQVNDALKKVGPAMFRTVDDVKGAVDLSSFRQRFAGNDKDLGVTFDRTAESVVKLAFREASQR